MDDFKKYGYLAYLGPLWIAGLLLDDSKDSRLRFHINQGFMLFLFECVIIVISVVLGMIPFLGGLLTTLFGFVAYPVCVLYMVTGIMNVSKNRQRPLPYIGFMTIIK